MRAEKKRGGFGLCQKAVGEAAMNGEEIIIAKAGRPAAKLVSLKGVRRQPVRFGVMKGEIEICEDFDAPLPEDLQRAFEGDQ